MNVHRKKLTLLIATMLSLLLAVVGTLSVGAPIPVIAAQSTRDSIPTRTPSATSAPLATPSATTEAAGPLVWVGRLVSNTLGVTEGNGSIFRVSVDGIVGAPIELRTDDQLITADSGSKAEYGPYTAEFAPVTEGLWTVRVPSLNAEIQVFADNYNLAVIEFSQIPAPQATQVVQPTVTPTALGGQLWVGRVVSETPGDGAQFGRLLVQVTGRNGQPVQISTLAEVINTAPTGQKPDELGPDTVEFTGLTPAKYIIEPLGLNTRLDVELKANVVTRVEFSAQPVPATATETPLPPLPTFTVLPQTATSAPTATPLPTRVALLTPTATALPLPTPVTRWLGAVAVRERIEQDLAVVVVKVAGVEGAPVRLRLLAGSEGRDQRCLTGQNTAEADVCAFETVSPGEYVLAPEGVGLSLPLSVSPGEKILVVFDLEVLPPGVTGWTAFIDSNTNGSQALLETDGIITVRVEGRVGQVVALRSVRGTEDLCEVAHNPLLGGLYCEFDGLGPGVYLVEVLHTGASQRVFVDGRGQARLTFSPAVAAPISIEATPVVGRGAQPRPPTPTSTPSQTTTPQPSATATPTPARRVTFTPTPTVTPTVSPTPTPVFAWQGRVVEQVNGVVGTIAVRAAGLEGHPVVLRSGGWESPVQLTGTKPELGEYATEFGGLSPGEYEVELVDLAEFKVNLGGGQFLLIEFRYDFVNPPPN